MRSEGISTSDDSCGLLSVSEWYQGRIVSLTDDGWDVLYLDDELDFSLCRACVRSFVPYSVGEMVAWQNGERNWVECEILDYNAIDGTYDIQSSFNDSVVRDVEMERLRRGIGSSQPNEGEGWNESDRVLAGFPGVEGDVFPGTVSRVFPTDGKYEIRYDDGDVAVVSLEMIVGPLAEN